jgi:hypothetical protein
MEDRFKLAMGNVLTTPFSTARVPKEVGETVAHNWLQLVEIAVLWNFTNKNI